MDLDCIGVMVVNPISSRAAVVCVDRLTEEKGSREGSISVSGGGTAAGVFDEEAVIQGWRP